MELGRFLSPKKWNKISKNEEYKNKNQKTKGFIHKIHEFINS